MKRWIVAGCSLAGAFALVALMPFVGGCGQSAKSAPVSDQPASTTNQSVADTAGATDAADQGLANAPGAIISTPSNTPDTSNNPQLNDVVKLVRAGVNESILMAYVTNSPSAFNVSSDDVVYLNDLGVPQTVVTAMLQRDQYFNSAATQAPAQPDYPSAAPVQPAANPPTVVETPAPDQSALPPGGAAGSDTTEVTPPLTPSQDVVDDVDQSTNGAYSYFYDSLSPYGNWININGYGPCWQPTTVVINPGWQPYCNAGHWVFTDCGWCWVSDYSWGWAPFHYGRWFHHSRWGWCWAPDTVWGPAWVSWRYNGGYCGWAPLPPTACYRPGYGFTFFGRSVGFNFAFGLEPASFVFVPLGHFHERSLSQFRVGHREVAKIFPTTVLNNQLIRGPNNTLINRGVPVEQVAAATRMEIRPVHIRNDLGNPGAAQFGRNGLSLSLYKPSLPTARLTSRPTLVGEGVQRDANFNLQSRLEQQAPQRPSVAPTVPSEPERRPIISNPTATIPRDDTGSQNPGNNVFSQPAWRQSPGRVYNGAPNQWPYNQGGQTAQPTVPAQNNRRVFTPQDSAPRYSAPQWQQRPQQPNMAAPRQEQSRQETSPRYYEQPQPRSYESPRSAPAPAQSAPARQESGQSSGNANNNNGNGNGGGGSGGGHGH